jgi:hypothetical protein
VCNREIALPRAVSLGMMKVADFKTPASIFTDAARPRIIATMNYNHF